MTELLKKHTAAASFGAFAARPMYPGAPRIAFAPDDGTGNGGSQDGTDGKTGSDEGEGSDDKSGASGNETDDKSGADDKSDKTDKNADAGKGDDKTLLREVMEKKGEINKLKAQLAKFDGIDPDAVRALLDEKRQAELRAEEEKGNFARVKEMMAEEHKKDKQTLESTIEDLKAQLSKRDTTINELTIGRSFSESSFIGEDLVLTRAKARQLYSDHFEVVDGKIIGYDKPKNATDRTQLIDAAGKPVSFDEAIKRIIDADPEKDSLYRDKAKPGAASNSTKVDPGTDKSKGDNLFGASRILAGLNAGK